MMFFDALIIPCAKLPGSLTTHCAFTFPTNRLHTTSSIIIFVFIRLLLYWLVTPFIFSAGRKQNPVILFVISQQDGQPRFDEQVSVLF